MFSSRLQICFPVVPSLLVFFIALGKTCSVTIGRSFSTNGTEFMHSCTVLKPDIQNLLCGATFLLNPVFPIFTFSIIEDMECLLQCTHSDQCYKSPVQSISLLSMPSHQCYLCFYFSCIEVVLCVGVGGVVIAMLCLLVLLTSLITSNFFV